MSGGPHRNPRYETVVTLATALPRSRSVAPRPAAPSKTGAATEMPAPPRKKPMRATGTAADVAVTASPRAERSAPPASRVRSPETDAQPVTKDTAADHGSGEEGRPETGEDR